MTDDISFRPLAEADMPLLHAWLNNPDVARWYGLGIENTTNPTMEQVIENYSPRINGDAPTLCYIIEFGGRPVGHIQAYRIGDYPIYARAIDYDDDAWGIDLFIGEDDTRGGGFGTRALDRFVETEVFSRRGVEIAVIAPNPGNARAIRCYEKAAFTHVKTVFVEMEGEEEYVMARRK
jgi:RimJ/RimL family protein N-acetyltransferase